MGSVCAVPGPPRSASAVALLDGADRYGSVMSASAAVASVEVPDLLLRACDLPGLIADDDGRGRVVAIRQFVKDWAAADLLHRRRMISAPPRRRRLRHRFGARRFDLARIAAVVDALCERDGVQAPSWVAASRARRPVSLTKSRLDQSPWNDWVRSVAPPACGRHSVWFVPATLDDHRVHGFR